MLYTLSDTICAQSTAHGRAGIHVIRVSGAKAKEITSQIFPVFRNLKNINSHYVYYGFIVDPESLLSIDEVMVTYFEAGRSFSTEETIEISCHGNPLIVKQILDLLIKYGCRMAERGEFSYRAYKGGRLSIPQTEALLSLIESNNTYSVAKSLRFLTCDISLKLKDIEDSLIWAVSRLEARIDFSTEDIEVESNDVIIEKLKSLFDMLTVSLDNFTTQNVLNLGIKTVIVGPPNAGKSSLFNYIVGTNRSIVSEVPGTTRDYLSETVNIKGKTFEFIDTAGIRLTNEHIEKLGIAKVNELLSVADVIIFLVSATDIESSFFEHLDPIWKTKKIITVVNKIDLVPNFNVDLLDFGMNISDFSNPKTIGISVSQKINIELLMTLLSESFLHQESFESLEVVSLRQAQELQIVLNEIDNSIEVLNKDLGDELVLSHLNRALKALFSVSNIENEEVIRDRIFKDFCLGK